MDNQFMSHLAVGEFAVPAGGELPLRQFNWTVIQIKNGTGYYLQPHLNNELATKMVLLMAGRTNGTIRASLLGELSFSVFSVIPSRLTGLITLVEQAGLEGAVANKESHLKIIPASDPVASRLMELLTCQNRDRLLFRVKLLELFIELVEDKLEALQAEENFSDAKQRLQLLIKQTPTSELLEMDFNELAQKTHCTARHLGRIFKQLVGMSFSARRDALRLERARELLATSNFKIVDVALESGYRSLSHFNHMFARNFGISPGKWRKKNENGAGISSSKGKRIMGKNSNVYSLINNPGASGQYSDISGNQVGKPVGRLTFSGGARPLAVSQ